MKRALLLALLLAAPAWAGIEELSSREAAAGMKAALEKGSAAAVASLGRPDGFFGNNAVKIPLPESLARYERLMRSVGMGRQADELVLALNRAAEAAVPEARAILIDAVKKMTVQDAKGILTGGETAGTEYFRRTTSDTLRARFLPIVRKATQKVQLARTYNEYAEKGAAFGLVSREDADLDSYVARKALDGLFLMVGEEEKKIRRDPVRAGSEILRKVFGALQ